MSGKCAVIGSGILVLAIITAWILYSVPYFDVGDSLYNNQRYPTLTLQEVNVKCKLHEIYSRKRLSSFIQTTSGDQDSRLNGLAVYLELTNACQPLQDVSKGNVQSHKVALVTLNDTSQTRCPFQKLAVNAQNAGYAVFIYFGDSPKINVSSPTHGDILLIPVLYVYWRKGYNGCKNMSPGDEGAGVDYNVLKTIHFFNVVIVPLPSNELIQMLSYLDKLYFWFLVGPIITLGWLRRTKKFCWMSGGQQLDNNGRTDENEAEIRTMEEGGNRTEGSHLHSNIENYRDRDGEEQPLLATQPATVMYTRQSRGTGCVNFKSSLRQIAVGILYETLLIAALPVGISYGGLSYFRFDNGVYTCLPVPFLIIAIVWPTLQIFCFFMYSWFACKITWTIETEFSKLIRSDWFASNIYLLVLGFVMPYCSFSEPFPYFVTYNTVCTVCNVLFIFILNKHKVVTWYVFYISICMICAYVESDIVAVFYFALNSQGSLSNLKLTALRTVATVLTLNISFNSSMHIVRKLVKPQESLFEGLGEK